MEDHRDGVDITPSEIFAWSDEHKSTPKTAAPSLEDAVESIGKLLADGNEVICFSISETMSSSFNIMRLAIEELDERERAFAFNSANLSTGIGLLVVEAACMAKEGMCAEEILKRLEELRPRVRSSFVVDTLTYLHRGGRCSGVAALAGGMLKLHPKIVVVDGKMCGRGHLQPLRTGDPWRVVYCIKLPLYLRMTGVVTMGKISKSGNSFVVQRKY